MKSLIIFPVTLLIGIYVIVAMIIPKYQQAKTFASENKILQEQVQDQVEQLSKIEAFVSELDGFSGEVDFLNEYVPSNPLEQDLFNNFSKFSSLSKVTIEEIGMNDKTKRSGAAETPLGRLGTNVSVTGTYEEIMPFIDNIYRIKRLYKLDSLNIAKANESNAPAGEGVEVDDLTLSADFQYIFVDNIPEVTVNDFTKKISFEEIAAVRDQINPVDPIVSAPKERSNPFITP